MATEFRYPFLSYTFGNLNRNTKHYRLNKKKTNWHRSIQNKNRKTNIEKNRKIIIANKANRSFYLPRNNTDHKHRVFRTTSPKTHTNTNADSSYETLTNIYTFINNNKKPCISPPQQHIIYTRDNIKQTQNIA